MDESRDEIQKALIENECREAFEQLNVGGIAELGGFYSEESNARARTIPMENGKWGIQFNENTFNGNEQEISRLVWHETQHIAWSVEAQNNDASWLFVFHPTFEDLYSRLTAHYQKYKEQEYPFKKSLNPLPASYDEMGNANDNYAHPDELLALLRGYERYIKQQENTLTTANIQPYEFIEAFKPEDLILLDSSAREQLATEVTQNRPEILLTKPQISSTSEIVWG